MPNIAGSNFRVKVNTGTVGTPVWTVVQDLTDYTLNNDRQSSSVSVFDKATRLTTYEAREGTMTLDGLFNDNDPGQQALRSASASNAVIGVQILWDGTNGFSQDVRVGGGSQNARPGEYLTTSFSLGGAADPVIVGTGPLP